eukprot:TRINITY_DN24874_c0_g1_i1.p4 TRINITY_DN24874_c0_g1~~TRINITY_DN24874_c0_g1_i1.p4  ORF type:complete len:164 (-),score=4.71 TRINITY_DN24874_c0_g1_i1:1739-2230(-)
MCHLRALGARLCARVGPQTGWALKWANTVVGAQLGRAQGRNWGDRRGAKIAPVLLGGGTSLLRQLTNANVQPYILVPGNLYFGSKNNVRVFEIWVLRIANDLQERINQIVNWAQGFFSKSSQSCFFDLHTCQTVYPLLNYFNVYPLNGLLNGSKQLTAETVPS